VRVREWDKECLKDDGRVLYVLGGSAKMRGDRSVFGPPNPIPLGWVIETDRRVDCSEVDWGGCANEGCGCFLRLRGREKECRVRWE
jgi:hypothetical protein